MSKENVVKFLEFLGKNPEIVQEGKKYDDGKGDMSLIMSKLAKDKGFEFTASEFKEAMEEAEKHGSKMSEDDLANVAGGANTEQWVGYGLERFQGMLEGMLNSADKDGKINWKDAKTYIHIAAGGLKGSQYIPGGTPTPGTPAGQ